MTDTPTTNDINNAHNTAIHNNNPAPVTHTWSNGRCIWYNAQHEPIKPLLIGITGASASGKSTVCNLIVKKLNRSNVICISMDSFYKHNTDAELQNLSSINFDHPKQFDWPLFIQCIQQLSENKVVHIPTYSFVTHTRTSDVTTIYGADVILIDGLFTLYDESIRSLLDLCIFVETESDICLARRIKRDIQQRGRTLESVLEQYFSTVKPGYDNFIAPCKKYADIVVPHGGDSVNVIAIDLLVKHIQTKLHERESKSHDTLKQLHTNTTNGVSGLTATNFTILAYQYERAHNMAEWYIATRYKQLIDFYMVVLTLIPRPNNNYTPPVPNTFPVGNISIKYPIDNQAAQLASCAVVTNIHTYNKICLVCPMINQSNDIECIRMGIQVLLDHHVQQSNIELITEYAPETSINYLASLFPYVFYTVAFVK